MRHFLHALLILAIGSVHAFGAYITVEIRHCDVAAEDHHDHCPTQKESPGDHHHDHHHGHDHAPCEEPTGSSDCDGDENGDGSNCPAHEHCHTKNLGGGAPAIISDSTGVSALQPASHHSAPLGRDHYPDGPCYALIKPPQLG